MKPDEAKALYGYLNEKIKAKYGAVETSVFGADMKVSSIFYYSRFKYKNIYIY